MSWHGMANLVLGARAAWALAAGALLFSAVGAGAEETSASDLANACIVRLAEIANRPVADIAATAIAPDGEGYVVTLALDGAENPWLCHVGIDGAVIDVIYQGEG